MNDIKTILLLGRTGNGKSTLANIITGTSKFTEGEFAVSETRKVSDYVFEHGGIKYRVVDTVGFGDTGMTLDKVLRKLALMSYSVKGGLSQILFVTDGQLAKEARSTYNLLREVVFDKDIAKYTTIVRTNFSAFEKSERCEEEKKDMAENSKEFKELIEECNGKVIFVDNPPTDIIGGGEGIISFNKKKRETSRKILLDHLNNVCQSDAYNPKNLVDLGDSEIGKWEKEKEGLKKGKAHLIDEAKNSRLNKKITDKMLDFVERHCPELRKAMEEWLKKSDEIFKWSFEHQIPPK